MRFGGIGAAAGRAVWTIRRYLAGLLIGGGLLLQGGCTAVEAGRPAPGATQAQHVAPASEPASQPARREDFLRSQAGGMAQEDAGQVKPAAPPAQPRPNPLQPAPGMGRGRGL